MEHTQENIERIADKIIDGLELEDLIVWFKIILFEELNDG